MPLMLKLPIGIHQGCDIFFLENAATTKGQLQAEHLRLRLAYSIFKYMMHKHTYLLQSPTAWHDDHVNCKEWYTIS